MVTSKRGERKYKNDSRFLDWSQKCVFIIKEVLHKEVFWGFKCKNGLISVQNSPKISPGIKNQKSKKTKDLEMFQILKNEAVYLVSVSNALKASQISITEDCELKIKPETLIKARIFADIMTSNIDKIVDQMKIRNQFWLCLK